jgi:asparaginyl-tRNA synthetase
MLEAEVAFVDTLPELLSTVEQGIKAAVAPLVVDEASNVSGSGLVDRGARNRSDLVTIRRNLRDEAGEVLDKSFAGLDITRDFLDRPFGQMSYTDAIELLQQRHQSHPFVHPPIWGAGLQSEHEKYLAGSVERGPLFVHDYPVALKPFYMRLNDQMAALPPSMARNTDDHSTVACFDLLVPDIGELVGGSLREERFDNLERAIDRHGLDKQAYDWYLDLRRFGSVKHGGWGMGWERFVCWVTGVGNVRDVVAFPRWKGHCRY